MEVKRYKGIIFDLDGVICFTDKYHYKAWKKLADELGIYFDEEINNRLRGVSRMQSLEIILERAEKSYSMEEKQELAERKNAEYVGLLQNMTAKDMSQEVREVLQTLREAGYKLAIGSSSKNAKLILQRLDLTDFFDVISDGTNIVKSKPDPEVFQKAAEYLGLEPKDCLVVEDAKAGIDAANRGGFDNAGLGEAAVYSQTTYTLGRFSSLLELLV